MLCASGTLPSWTTFSRLNCRELWAFCCIDFLSCFSIVVLTLSAITWFYNGATGPSKLMLMLAFWMRGVMILSTRFDFLFWGILDLILYDALGSSTISSSTVSTWGMTTWWLETCRLLETTLTSSSPLSWLNWASPGSSSYFCTAFVRFEGRESTEAIIRRSLRILDFLGVYYGCSSAYLLLLTITVESLWLRGVDLGDGLCVYPT